MDPGNYVQQTAGYSFTNGDGASNSIIGIDNMTVYGGGGKRSKKPKRGKAKRTKAKRTKAKQKKTPLRKRISKRVKQMSKMRMKYTKQLTKREKKLAKRLKHRKTRTDVIDSLASSTPLSKQTINSLSPSMKKFVSKIPTDSKASTQLTSWPSISFGSPSPLAVKSIDSPSLHDIRPPKLSKSSRQKKFEEARKGLADLLKKKPVYDQSKSVITFSDYKSKKPNKEKAVQKAKSKKKGQTR
jgi:hypothetical protein